MWWDRSDNVDVFLGRTRLGLHQPGRPVLWERGDSAAELWTAAREVLGAGRRAKVRVWLSGSLARPFVLPAMDGLGTIGEARMIAATRAPEETGLEGPCWVSIDTWQPGAPTLCVAMDEALRRLVGDGGNTGKIRVVGIRPWWSAVLCDEGADAGALSVLTVDDGESLVTLAGADDQIAMASSYTPAPQGEQRAALVQRILSAVSGGAGARRHASLSTASEVAAEPVVSACAFAPVWEIAP